MEVQLRVPWAVRYSSLRRRILNATGGTGSVESNSFVRLLELASAHGNRSVGGLHYLCQKFTDPLDPVWKRCCFCISIHIHLLLVRSRFGIYSITDTSRLHFSLLHFTLWVSVLAYLGTDRDHRKGNVSEENECLYKWVRGERSGAWVAGHARRVRSTTPWPGLRKGM